MAKRPETGLVNWTQKSKPPLEPEPNGALAFAPNAPRRRAKGDTVAITVRLNRQQWERLHEFAVHEGDSLQGLVMRGLTRLLQEKGLKGLCDAMVS